MDKDIFLIYLKSRLSALKIDILPDAVESLGGYFSLLIEANKKHKFTALPTPEDIAEFLFVDSLLGLKEVKDEETLVDVGSGGGFPGLVLKIAKPKLKVTLLDSTFKRVVFLKRVLNKLNLLDAEVIHGRAEDLGRKELRESFDVAVAKALAPLPMSLELCSPLVKVGGRLLLWKGEEWQKEVLRTGSYPAKLGLEFLKGKKFGDMLCKTVILEYVKVSKTPHKYPRSFKKMASEWKANT